MSHKTIAKFSAFVISAFVAGAVCSGCHKVSSSDKQESADKAISADYEKPAVIGTIKSGEVTESSGLIASRCAQDVFWTHNDSGDGAFLYAFDRRGARLGTWKVTGAQHSDWEDLATYKNANGECFLYIGDIGNNARARDELTIYRVKEPQISERGKSSTRKNALVTETADAIRIAYPDLRHNAETLVVHPQTGDIYVLSKRMSGASGVYRLAADYDTQKTNTLEKIADLSVPAIPNGLLTGGDIAPDGRRAIFCDYVNAYEIILPAQAKNFDEIWTQKPLIVELGPRAQGEAISYSADARSIFATSEKKNSPIIEVKRK